MFLEQKSAKLIEVKSIKNREIRMFNLSFSEIFLILVLAIIFLKPSDFPTLIKQAKAFFNKFLTVKNSVLDEINEIKDDLKTIEDDVVKKEPKDDK